MAFEELLAWAGNRPAWQQDGLRRLALSGEFTETDLSDLSSQIELKAGLPVQNVPAPAPLAPEHLSAAASNQPKTVLASLGPVQGVDRLASDQPPLRFAVNGVTLVYGANASGKSGYCRIAKQLCRSLSPGTLRGNVYAGQAGVGQVAVGFRVGDDDQDKQEINWASNAKPPGDLARISVFDTATARVYVDKERKIEFLPYELDLLNKLGLGCRILEQRFKDRETAATAAVATPLPAGFTEGTNAHAALAKLVTSTPIDQLPTEQELRALAAWTEENEAELKRAAQALNNNPKTLMRLRNEAKQALQSMKDEITKIVENLADPAIAQIRAQQRDADTKARAAEAAARDMFSGEPIADVGSEVWRQMLLYARQFASSVFADKEPPQLATGGVCVLCQQDLDDDAARRLAAFDSFIAGRSAEDSASAKRLYEGNRDQLLALVLRRTREIEPLLAGYAALSKERKDNAAGTCQRF